MTIDEAKHKDFYNLFPDCKECQRLRLTINQVINPYQEELTEGLYGRHLIQDHKLSRLEICNMTGVFIC